MKSQQRESCSTMTVLSCGLATNAVLKLISSQGRRWVENGYRRLPPHCAAQADITSDVKYRCRATHSMTHSVC
jgi:hypothetical protein